MLRLLLCLTCLLAAVAAQRSFYCNQTLSIIRDQQDFYLITRRPGEINYPAGLVCEFNAESRSGYYFVEIQAFQVSTAVLTISSGGSTLFSGSGLQRFEATLSTASRYLRVRFDATRDSNSYLNAGVTIRVREFETSGCPPDWMRHSGYCYGTGKANGRLNFTDAQKACNKMRSNLFQRPPSMHSIGALVRSLPSSMKSYYTWIGLTDRTREGRFAHYWLNGQRHSMRSEISCVSGGSYASCYTSERCGTIYDRRGSIYAIYMDTCSDLNNFACSMPRRGTGVFYEVPVPSDSHISVAGSSSYRASVLKAIGIIVGISVLGGILYAFFGGKKHYKGPRRTMGPASVVVSTGAVTDDLSSHKDHQLKFAPPPDYSTVAAADNCGGQSGCKSY